MVCIRPVSVLTRAICISEKSGILTVRIEGAKYTLAAEADDILARTRIAMRTIHAGRRHPVILHVILTAALAWPLATGKKINA